MVSSPVHCDSTIIDKVKEIKKAPGSKRDINTHAEKEPGGDITQLPLGA
jgi:hypothetical protein